MGWFEDRIEVEHERDTMGYQLEEIDKALRAFRKAAEDELTENLGRPLARGVLRCVDTVAALSAWWNKRNR